MTVGAIYALVALGFVTISRAYQIINIAQGEFVMLGGVLTFFFLNGLKLPYPLAALIAILIVVLIGFAMHLSILYPLRKASILILIMATLGASIFLSSTSGLIFGTLPKTLPPFSGGEPLQIWKISFPPQSLWVLSFTFILLIFLYLLSHRTLLGKAMEASSTDPLGADLLGISRNLMVFLAFGVSAGVGALVVGIALQGTFANILSGLLTFKEDTLRVGDVVEVGSGAGKGHVVKVGLRNVWIKTESGALLVLGHATLDHGRYWNYTAAERLKKEFDA
jgi:branched-subunit amino acid ABC-type transport system permease component